MFFLHFFIQGELCDSVYRCFWKMIFSRMIFLTSYCLQMYFGRNSSKAYLCGGGWYKIRHTTTSFFVCVALKTTIDTTVAVELSTSLRFSSVFPLDEKPRICWTLEDVVARSPRKSSPYAKKKRVTPPSFRLLLML